MNRYRSLKFVAYTDRSIIEVEKEYYYALIFRSKNRLFIGMVPSVFKDLPDRSIFFYESRLGQFKTINQKPGEIIKYKFSVLNNLARVNRLFVKCFNDFVYPQYPVHQPEFLGNILVKWQ